MDRRPVRRLKPDPGAPRPPDGEWPVTVPAVAQLLLDETLHGLYGYLESIGGEPSLHELSHGEGFLTLFGSRATRRGFYLLDEPDAALSFAATLSLVVRLTELVAMGAQRKDPVLTTLRRLRAVPWTGPRSAPGSCARRGGPTWS